MALGDNTLQSARGNTQRGRNPYMVQTVLNLATALSDKGSALAASDVIPVIAVPKGNMVLNAGIEVDTASDGSTFTVDLGMVDADVFVDGFDATSAAAVVAQNPAAYQPVMAVANDNIDLTIATLSGGAVSTGKLRIWAVMMDCSDMGQDMTANEVDRDYLA
jgi:hypothetical protein|tara:strand:+ start:37 stop:522 length:486 start_codon:yes stop_codon:yes gene_type:complete